MSVQNFKIYNKVVNDKFRKMSVFMLNSMSQVLVDTEQELHLLPHFSAQYQNKGSVSKQRLNYDCPCGENRTIMKLWDDF